MKKIRAFSLLETILSLSILGLMSSCIITLYFFISKNQKSKINEQKYHYIRIAMQNYLLKHGKLPTASENDLGQSSLHLTSGYVPYRSLGIAKSYMYDANKKPFKYVVNQLFTRTNIPIHTPLTYKPKQNEQSFLRLYCYKDETLYYDGLAKNNELIILDKNNISVIDEKDFFFVMTPLIAPFKKPKAFRDWIENNQKKKDEYKVFNLVAWLIISFGYNKESEEHQKNANKNNNKKFFIESKNKYFSDIIFFQSRFDLAAQIGFYTTAEPIYDPKEE